MPAFVLRQVLTSRISVGISTNHCRKKAPEESPERMVAVAIATRTGEWLERFYRCRVFTLS